MVRKRVPTTDLTDADLVLAARDGDAAAFSALFDRWFDRCFDVAVRILHDREAAADVAQDTFLTVWRKLDSLRDPEAFGGWVLRASRNTALTRLERERRSVALGDDTTTALADAARAHPDAADAVTRLEQRDLVWAAAAALGERDASVLDLHLRHGLEPAEIAEALGIAPNAAHQVLFRLRARLGTAVAAWVLWNDGEPRCDDLAAVLHRAGITAFGPDAVKVIGRHADGCPVCEDDRAGALAPEVLFASVPLVAAPAALRERVLDGLTAEGVPARAPGGRRPRGAVGAGVVAAVVILLAAIALLARDEGDEVATADDRAPTTTTTADGVDDPTTTTTAGSTTTGDPTTSTSAPPTSLPATVPVVPTSEPPLSGGPTTTTAPADDTGTVPPTVAPPPDTTAPPPPPPPPAAPTITSFTVAFDGLGPCGSASGRLWTLTWTTTDATEVTLTGPTVGAGPHPADGSVATCTGFGPAPTWQLTATGPGGTASQSATG